MSLDKTEKGLELPRPKDALIDDFMEDLDVFVWARMYGRQKDQKMATKHLRQSLEELIS